MGRGADDAVELFMVGEWESEETEWSLKLGEPLHTVTELSLFGTSTVSDKSPDKSVEVVFCVDWNLDVFFLLNWSNSENGSLSSSVIERVLVAAVSESVSESSLLVLLLDTVVEVSVSLLRVLFRVTSGDGDVTNPDDSSSSVLDSKELLCFASSASLSLVSEKSTESACFCSNDGSWTTDDEISSASETTRMDLLSDSGLNFDSVEETEL